MYRLQVFGNDMTGMHWHLHKNSARHYHEYKNLGKKMPVSVTLGGDPVYTYAATAPLPDNFDEYILAGFLRRKKVKMGFDWKWDRLLIYRTGIMRSATFTTACASTTVL